LFIVRNPLDVIPSFALLCNTLSHSATLEFSFDKEYPVWWDWWVKFMTDAIDKFFTILFKDTIDDGRNPIHISRFEDLCDDPNTEVESMMKFTLDLDDLSGTNM